MSDKNKKDEEKNDSIPAKIIEAISSIEQELLMHSDSCPPCLSEAFDISEILDEKKKKEKEKEYTIGNYLIKRTLGQGTFGKVKLGIYLPSQEKVAIKILEKDRILEKDDEIRVKREFDMLALFNNPNVILVAEIFESADSFYSVMEFCEGGELFNYIVKNRRLSEEEAAFFYYQLITGLEYIHSLGIVHRDLKPENLLLTKDHLLKIIDFGLSNYFKEGQKELLVTPCGSPCYASPEMVAGKTYDGFKIDIWSTGIILYAMLCGYLPFEDKDNERLFEKILECKLEFPKFITETSKDLLKKILVTDPDTRIDIPGIKKHPFYLKGKEIFEQEFSICQIEKEDNDINIYENVDLKNILDNSVLKTEVEKENLDENINENINVNLNDKKDKKEEKPKKDKKVKNNKEKSEKKTRNKEKEKSLNLLDQANIMQRLNTEYDEKRSNLRTAILDGLNKAENNEIKQRNSSSVKKNNNKNNNNKNKANNNGKIVQKKNGPFKKRDIILLKNDKNILANNHKDDNTKMKARDLKNNNKKLTKTSNYRNIRRNNKNKDRENKSVNLRNRIRKNDNKNLVHRRINYTNIIQNKFNSKENIISNKVNKKDNIYNNNINNNTINSNNINNTIDEDSMTNRFNYDFNFNYGSKKARSKAKKNAKLKSIENTFNQKNKKYLANLFTINSSIKKYENILNTGGIHIKKKNKKEKSVKDYLFGNDEKNKDEANNSKKEITHENNAKAGEEKLDITKFLNNTNPNINIIDYTADEDIESIEINNNENPKINDNSTNLKKVNKNRKSPKKTDNNLKVNKEKDKEKSTKKNMNKTNKSINMKQHNSNLRGYKKRNIRLNYYYNEIEPKKTIENDNTKRNKYGINDIYDDSEMKKNLKKRNNERKQKSINKTSFGDKESLDFHNKKGFALDNSITKNNNSLNITDAILRTEPNKIGINSKGIAKNINKNINNEKNDKNKIYKKISTPNTNDIKPQSKNKKNYSNRRQYNLLANNTKTLNKTTNTTINPRIKNQLNSNNQNILDLINTSNRNTHENSNKKINKRKSDKVVSNNNNYKKPNVTIKNTVINFNIDTGIILSSVDKRRKAKKINSKRVINNSVNRINNNLIGLNSKYNDYLTNATIAKINHSNTNENFPIKTKSININDNFNLLSFNEEADSNNNYSINKNTNYQKIYIYGEKTAYKNRHKQNNLKDDKNENSRLNTNNNNNTSNRGRKHMKFKSMKLDDFCEKDKKLDNKNINETSFNK